jgi:hypothetical protein
MSLHPLEQIRQQHGHPLAIAPVFIAEQGHQIAFLEIDTDEDVSRRHRCEQQMPQGHGRRTPEGDDEAEIDRVPDQAIQPLHLEPNGRSEASGKMGDYLRQSEQLEGAGRKVL